MADRLAGAGFEVERAPDGEQALALLSRQWMPVVITDWQMPVMDGIAFTEQLRARGVEDTYVIMLTMRESSMDYERGYYAGVDDYLTKKLPDAELFARIHAGFNTLAFVARCRKRAPSCRMPVGRCRVRRIIGRRDDEPVAVGNTPCATLRPVAVADHAGCST